MVALVPPVITPDASATLEELTETIDELSEHNAVIIIDCIDLRSVSYTHLTLPTNREV